MSRKLTLTSLSFSWQLSASKKVISFKISPQFAWLRSSISSAREETKGRVIIFYKNPLISLRMAGKGTALPLSCLEGLWLTCAALKASITKGNWRFRKGMLSVMILYKPTFHSLTRIQPLSVWDSFEDLIQCIVKVWKCLNDTINMYFFFCFIHVILGSFSSFLHAVRVVSHWRLATLHRTAFLLLLKSTGEKMW